MVWFHGFLPFTLKKRQRTGCGTSSAAVGPGGSLLGQAHTRRHARDAAPDGLMNRDPYETWVAHGSRDLATRADARVAELLAAYTPPDDLDEVTVRQLREYCLA